MEKKSFRILTNPGEGNNQITVKLQQNYDYLEILSLKISQDKIYNSFSSDYGVLVGRVIANQGLGLPNAKVSVFIPISDEDKANQPVANLYSFESVTDTDLNGIRYNVLPNTSRYTTITQTTSGQLVPPEQSGAKLISNMCSINGYSIWRKNIFSVPFKVKCVNNAQPPNTLDDSNGWEKVSETKTGVTWTTRIDSGIGPDAPVGTFPSKQEILDNDTYVEVYEKYYKYTTVTNSSGDYMIFGVPVGQQTVHIDVDLSDIGQYTYTVADMLASGVPENLFEKITTSTGFRYQFKGGIDLERLPQIITRNASVEIIPLWGDVTANEIGITRYDFKLNIIEKPVAYVIFNLAVDNWDNDYDNDNGEGVFNDSYDKYIDNHGAKPGIVQNFNNRGFDGGVIQVYKPNDDGSEVRMVQGVDYVLEREGASYLLILPCYSGRKITNEFGEEIDSPDGVVGVASKGKYRIFISGRDNGTQWGNMSLQKLQRTDNGGDHYFEVERNNIYTVKMMIGFDGGDRRYGFRNGNDDNYNRNFFSFIDFWIHGILYFGAFNETEGFPSWLIQRGDNSWTYNTETRIVNITKDITSITSKSGIQTKGGFTYKVIGLNTLDNSTEVTPIPDQSGYFFGFGWDSTSCFNMIKRYI